MALPGKQNCEAFLAYGLVSDLPYKGVRGVIHQAPAERVPDLLLVIGWHQRPIRAIEGIIVPLCPVVTSV